ncbi:MAG: LysR family transcriptional regulator [Azospirillaceae bacterium]|nr:LysR family transcriptional regulator [Azospirillaceae bacterium]
MDAGDLRVFEAVARSGSMNRAAATLHTVQSNVTARIRALEAEIGVTLFERHARGVTLTAAGQRMLPFVGRITKLFADARSAACDDGSPGGALLLGSLETTAALRLSPLLSRFARQHPQVRLAVSTGTTARLVADVIDGRLDGAFVAGPVDHPRLHREVVFCEELVLVTERAIRAPRDLAAIDELKTIVFQIGCCYRQRLDAVLARRGIVVTRPFEFGSIEAILACVSAGIGVTLLPKAVVAEAWQQGRVAVHELAPEEAAVETLFVHRDDAYISSAMTAFLAMARPGAAPAAIAAPVTPAGTDRPTGRDGFRRPEAVD